MPSTLLGPGRFLVLQGKKVKCDIFDDPDLLKNLPAPNLPGNVPDYGEDIVWIELVFSKYWGCRVRFGDSLEEFNLNPETMLEKHVLDHLAAKFRGGYQNAIARIKYKEEFLGIQRHDPANGRHFATEQLTRALPTFADDAHQLIRKKLDLVLKIIRRTTELHNWRTGSVNPNGTVPHHAQNVQTQIEDAQATWLNGSPVDWPALFKHVMLELSSPGSSGLFAGRTESTKALYRKMIRVLIAGYPLQQRQRLAEVFTQVNRNRDYEQLRGDSLSYLPTPPKHFNTVFSILNVAFNEARQCPSHKPFVWDKTYVDVLNEFTAKGSVGFLGIGARNELTKQFHADMIELLVNPFAPETEVMGGARAESGMSAMIPPHQQQHMRLMALLAKINYFSERRLWSQQSPTGIIHTDQKPIFVQTIYEKLLKIEALDMTQRRAELSIKIIYRNIVSKLKSEYIPECTENNLQFYMDTLTELESHVSL